MSLIEVSTPPSWSELRQTVRDVRSHFSNRGTRTPSGECFAWKYLIKFYQNYLPGLTFRRTGGRTRLYFLSEPATKRDTSLYYTDLPPTSSSQVHGNPSWCPLIESGFQVIPGPVRWDSDDDHRKNIWLKNISVKRNSCCGSVRSAPAGE